MKKGELTRQYIIEKSAPVFNKSGYGSTSMSDLMAATGLEKGGLYRHFSSKEELAAEAFAYAAAAAFEGKEAAMQAAASGVPRIQAFIQSFANTKSPIPGGCPVFNTAVENDFGNPVLKKKAAAAYLLWVKRLAQAIGEAQEQREVSAEIDREALAAFILCALEGSLIAANLTGNKFLVRQTADQLLRHLQTFVV